MSESEPVNLPHIFNLRHLSQLHGPINITPVDLSGVFNEIRTRYPTHAIQDLMRSFWKVIILSELPQFEENIIKTILVKCQKHEGFYYDSHYGYLFKADSAMQQVSGHWWTREVNSKHGDNLFSLVRTIKGCSDWEAFFYVSKILDVDLSEQDVVQYQSLEGETFVRESHAYPVNEKHNASTLFGNFAKEYTFNNDHGCSSFKLQVWNRDTESYQLFSSLQQCDKTEEKEWRFISPPHKYLIFNRHLMDRHNKKEVQIHDEIERADSFNSEMAIIATWSGDLSISSQLDWDFLKGRNISYIFDKYNLKSTVIGFQLIEKFLEIKTPLKLYSVPNFTHSKNYLIEVGQENASPDFKESRDIQINNLCSSMDAQGDLTIDDFHKFAKYYHGLGPKSQEIKPKTHSKAYNELDDLGDKDCFMVEDLFNEGQYIVMTAEQKVGKSRFALDLCLMIATGESIGDEKHISASKPCKTFLIDGEMPEGEFKKRMGELLGNYENQTKIVNNIDNCFRCYSVRPHNKKLDLSTPRDQQFIKNEIQDAKFVVFDNLGKLVPPKVISNDNLWEPVSEWFKSLTDGRTVFVVHHENAKKERRGTAKIYDDVDLALSLRNTGYHPGSGKVIELYIDDARYLPEDKTTFCYINYYSEDKMTKRIVYKDDSSLKDQDDGIVPGEKKSQSGLTPLQKEMLDPVRHSALGFVTTTMFIKENDSLRSRKKMRDMLLDLCEKGLLKTIGENKGAKFYLIANYVEPIPPADTDQAAESPP